MSFLIVDGDTLTNALASITAPVAPTLEIGDTVVLQFPITQPSAVSLLTPTEGAVSSDPVALTVNSANIVGSNLEVSITANSEATGVSLTSSFFNGTSPEVMAALSSLSITDPNASSGGGSSGGGASGRAYIPIAEATVVFGGC